VATRAQTMRAAKVFMVRLEVPKSRRKERLGHVFIVPGGCIINILKILIKSV
jgi:hypothetical protein